MKLPAVGTMVLYKPGVRDGLRSQVQVPEQRLAAIVCKTFERDATVNLRVFDENGNGQSRMKVAVAEEDEVVPGDDPRATMGYCQASRLNVFGGHPAEPEPEVKPSKEERDE